MNRKPLMLVIDDMEINRAILRAYFEEEYDIVELSGGQEAIDYMKEDNQISIVLLDIRMPEIDGFAVLAYMKAETRLAMIPVLMTTQYGQDDTEIRALSMGAADFITKPFNRDVVIQRVHNIVNKEKFDIFRYYVERDRLTGIYNREHFCQMTREMLLDHPEEKYVLITWNIARFKVINELFGIKMGDKVLKKMAQSIAQPMKGIGTYGRLEADNFAVCFPYRYFNIEEFSKELNNSFKNFDLAYDIAVYSGIYPIDDVNIPVDQMCDRANLALRTVKGNYIKRFAFYDDEIRNTIIQEQQIISEMDDAIEKKQFCVYLQPIYSASEGKPITAEALVRWIHPEKGVIAPGLFVPLFERNGLIMKLDYFVWEEVCSMIRRDLDAGRPVVPISVNVSRMNLYAQDLFERIIGLVEKYRLDPSYLKLEITESAYTDNAHNLENIIRKFQRYGFQIYMDDFGSGYSSLNMLKDISVDVLKLDREFINEIGESERAGSVLSSIVRMAKWLEMGVVAEGVETEEQLDFLRSIGCDRIQGFYYSRPLPVEDYRKLLANTGIAHKPERHVESVEKLDMQKFFITTERVSETYGDMLGACGIYEMFQDTLEIITVNEEYYRLTGSNSKTLFSDTKNACAWMHEEDKPSFFAACHRAAETNEVQETLIRRYHQNGTLMQMLYRIKHLGNRSEHAVYLVMFNDITKYVEQAENMQQTTAKTGVGSKMVETQTNGNGRNKILIVDDNQINRKVLRKMLVDSYEILEAENGKQALDIAVRESSSLAGILLDIVMPVMSGYEFLEAKSKMEQIAEIPVIVLSLAEDGEAENKALEHGASDFLKKPYEPAVIKQRLKHLVKLQETTNHTNHIDVDE